MQPTHDQAIFYLQFVDAAYTMYDSNSDTLTPPAQGFPDPDYEILSYLTSVDPVTGDRVFFGFIAADTFSSGKPGILAIRGTDNPYEWLTDFDAGPTPFPPFPGSYVATGFDEFVTGIEWVSPQGDTVARGADFTSGWPNGVVLAGHSLGGAMATLLAATWMASFPNLMLTLVTAASPAMGDYTFVTQFNAVCTQSWRYINDLDSIASSLDFFYYQTDTAISLYSADIWPTPECEHSLETYLWLLSPTGTPCGLSCCIADDEVKRRVDTVLGARRAARKQTR